jgi:L-seryl-tRNA(Ser) seleniumtransferase
MSLYETLGVRPVINAAAAQTVLGGSLMPEPVLAAMHEAAQSFVHLPELHNRVGERLAGLTRNEAACISCGASAGILLAVAAAMTGDDTERAIRLPDTTGLHKTEVIVFRGHHNGFLSAVRETGATLIEISGDPAALRQATTERTAAVLWFAGDFWPDDSLPLHRTVGAAHELGVPVIVDAADQIPPLSNLWQYTGEQGADLAIFSGGKGLRGPQSSGLIVGKADLIRACRANSGPMHSIGRPAKVGKEEMVGLLAAVEWSLARDENVLHAGYEAVVDGWIVGLSGVPGVSATKVGQSHSNQPIPRAILGFGSPAQRDGIIAALWDRDPRIAVLPDGEMGIGLNPQGLEPGEEEKVLEALRWAIGNRQEAIGKRN